MSELGQLVLVFFGVNLQTCLVVRLLWSIPPSAPNLPPFRVSLFYIFSESREVYNPRLKRYSCRMWRVGSENRENGLV